MKQKSNLSIGGVLLAILAAFFYTFTQGDAGVVGNAGNADGYHVPQQQQQEQQQPVPVAPRSQPASIRQIGFTSAQSWQDHFAKHGAEFGRINADEYLQLAKTLRDAPLSHDIVELVRADGVITRFDRRGGGFIAFHRDLAIKTFFRPNDGEAYFRRQAKR